MEYKDKEFESRFALKKGVYRKLEEAREAIAAMIDNIAYSRSDWSL